MARVCMIEKDKRRKRKNQRCRAKIEKLKAAQKELRKKYNNGEEISLDDMLEVQFKFQKQLPTDASRTRIHNRCRLTGRPRGYERRFGLCRNMLRDLGSNGMIPGLKKSSW